MRTRIYGIDSSKLDLIVCTHCCWAGEEDELKTQMVDNPFNPQDHTLYEEKVCPECETNDDLSKGGIPKQFNDEEFMDEAEKQGNVWTLQGFEKAFNNQDISDQLIIRIITK